MSIQPIMFNDRKIKKAYDQKIKSEDERKNVTTESSKQEEYINYIFVETGTNKHNESKM